MYKNNELVATGLVLIKRLPLSFCMYYLPRGPIMDYKDKELVQYYFDQLKKLAKKDHCIFIKFDPAIHVNDYDSKSYNINRYKDTEIYLDIFKSSKATHHGYTMNIPWWRSHPIHENRATESICTEPCNPLLRATKSMKRATSTY